MTVENGGIGNQENTGLPPKQEKKTIIGRIQRRLQPKPVRVEGSNPSDEGASPPEESNEFVDPGYVGVADLNDVPDFATRSKRNRGLRRKVKAVGEDFVRIGRLDNSIIDSPASMEKKKPQLMRRNIIATALTLVAGIACGIGLITAGSKAPEVVSDIQKRTSQALAGSGELKLYPGISEVLAYNTSTSEIVEADGVNMQEYIENIKVRNEIIGISRFGSLNGPNADMIKISASPNYGREMVFISSENVIKYLDTLLEGRLYKDGKPRSSFSLKDINDMKPEDGSSVRVYLANIMNMVSTMSYMVDVENLPPNNIVRSFVKPLRTQYESFSTKSDLKVVTAIALRLSPKGNRYEVYRSEFQFGSAEDRSPDFDTKFGASVKLLSLFAGGKYTPKQ